MDTKYCEIIFLWISITHLFLCFYPGGQGSTGGAGCGGARCQAERLSSQPCAPPGQWPRLQRPGPDFRPESHRRQNLSAGEGCGAGLPGGLLT